MTDVNATVLSWQIWKKWLSGDAVNESQRNPRLRIKKVSLKLSASFQGHVKLSIKKFYYRRNTHLRSLYMESGYLAQTQQQEI